MASGVAIPTAMDVEGWESGIEGFVFCAVFPAIRLVVGSVEYTAGNRASEDPPLHCCAGTTLSSSSWLLRLRCRSAVPVSIQPLGKGGAGWTWGRRSLLFECDPDAMMPSASSSLFLSFLPSSSPFLSFLPARVSAKERRTGCL